LHFFNYTIKKSASSRTFLETKPKLDKYSDSLWSIKKYPAIKSSPNKDEFILIINKKGIDYALATAKQIVSTDTIAEFASENSINEIAHNFKDQNKQKEALMLMRFAVEIHPNAAWLWNNLAGMEESFGNSLQAIRSSEKVLELLKEIKDSEMSFNERTRRSAQERIKRLQ
jgi:tetratricopeptide (TPR) repeat protein